METNSRSRILTLSLLLIVGAGEFIATSVTDDAASDRALITVRTLVIDALGTRTVDTDVARVPFGGTGLLIRKVPYGGPELSFRLAVTAGPPQESGIALAFSADIWSGGASPIPPVERMSHREEATVLSPDSSYLLELDHSERSDRRILLSISARRAGAGDIPLPTPSDTTGTIRFDLEVTRESDGAAEPVDSRPLSTMVGTAATYSSGLTIPGKSAGDPARFVGLAISITPERSIGDLVTVRTELSGADFVDPARTELAPIRLVDIRTVSYGTRFDLSVELRSPDENSNPRVTYRVSITPRNP